MTRTQKIHWSLISHMEVGTEKTVVLGRQPIYKLRYDIITIGRKLETAFFLRIFRDFLEDDRKFEIGQRKVGNKK